MKPIHTQEKECEETWVFYHPEECICKGSHTITQLIYRLDDFEDKECHCTPIVEDCCICESGKQLPKKGDYWYEEDGVFMDKKYACPHPQGKIISEPRVMYGSSIELNWDKMIKKRIKSNEKLVLIEVV